MPYIKAHIETNNGGDTFFSEGGFYTHAITAVLGNENTTEIVLDRQVAGGRYGDTLYTRGASINLPSDKVNLLLERLEVEGGVLDLLAHTKPDNPASAETPVPHRTARDQELTIDFNNLARRDGRVKHPLVPLTNKAFGSGPATSP